MKARLAAALIFLSLLGGSAAADHIPIAPPAPIALEPVARVIASAGSFDPFLEVVGRWNDPSPGFGYRSLTLGSYLRVARNLKLGGFYRLQAGARHNDDWIATGIASPGWIWRDTTNRYENLLVLDASPRFLLPLPGRNTVFMLKARWSYNFFNNQQSLMLRPGITYYFVHERRPIAEVALHYAAYLALNFGESLLYEQAPYVELFYHLTPEMQITLGASAVRRVWTTSASVLADTGAHYSVAFPSFKLQAGLIYRPSL